MAVTYRSVANITSYNTGSTITVNKPSGVVDDDVLITSIQILGSATINSVPSGWTLVRTQTISGSNTKIYVYYKVASSEGSSWNWGTTSSTSSLWNCAAFYDADTSTPVTISAISEVTNSIAPSHNNTISPSANSMLVISVITDQNIGNTSGYAIANSNPTWTEISDVGRPETGSNFSNLATAYGFRSASGATGNTSFNMDGEDSGNEDSICCILAINPSSTNYDLTAAVGSFILTGVAAALKIGKQLIASAGSFSLTGIAATLIPQRQPTITADSPADTANVGTTLPTFCFTGTDLDGDDLRYQIQIDTLNTFDGN